MKPMTIFFTILITFFSCKTEVPKQFSEVALNENIQTLTGETITFSEVLKQHKGKTIMLDFWASWCGDCIKSIPKVKALQAQFPETVYVFLSVDRKVESWKRGIQKYAINGEHYFLPKGMKKGDLVDFVNLSWIPRYMVVDPNGNITVFNAIETDNNDLQAALK